jgi:hypothetical protein
MGRWSIGRSVFVALALGAAATFAGCGDGLIGEAILGSGGDDGDNGDPPPPDAAPIVKPDAPVVVVTPDAPPAPATPDAPPSEPPPTFDVTGLTRENVMSIAEASVGYTYWWGHGSLGGTTVGTCTGSCPSCTHTGSHGADCSGFVGKAWMLPEAMPIVGPDLHPYSTYMFVHQSDHWSSIGRSDVIRGDAMVYNQNGAGHIFLYEKDDPWGSMWTFEARGCAYGIVHNIRTASSIFQAIRRDGL